MQDMDATHSATTRPANDSRILCSCDACGSDVTDVDQILCAACRRTNRLVRAEAALRALQLDISRRQYVYTGAALMAQVHKLYAADDELRCARAAFPCPPAASPFDVAVAS